MGVRMLAVIPQAQVTPLKCHRLHSNPISLRMSLLGSRDMREKEVANEHRKLQVSKVPTVKAVALTQLLAACAHCSRFPQQRHPTSWHNAGEQHALEHHLYFVCCFCSWLAALFLWNPSPSQALV